MTYIHETGRLAVPGHLKPTALGNPATGFTAWHVSSAEPLFPHEPKIEDIRQAQIGDCFLLGALAAIVCKGWGPDWILDMMKDQGTGSVAIRLYDDGGGERYFTVEKSIVYTLKSNTTLHSLGPLWVQIVEKAYTAYARGGTVPASYEQLAKGGKAADAMKILLGGESGAIRFDKGPGTDDFLGLLTLNSSLFESQVDPYRKALPRAYRSIMAANDQNPNVVVVDWIKWIENVNVVRLEDVERFFQARAACYSQSAKQDVLEWLETQKLLPGKRGTGRYSNAQLDLYNAIRAALANGQNVTLSTKQGVGKVDFFGHSSGEPVSKGLVGRHSYAVLSCRRDLQTQVRWIQVHNPWGDTGRSYQPSTKHQGALSAVATKAATFEVELSDVTKRFDVAYYGKRA